MRNLFLVLGCSVLFAILFWLIINTTDVDANDYSFNMQYIDSDEGIDVYEDTETGVQYLVCKGTYRASICPRYNQDGTLYKEQKNLNNGE